MALPVAIGRTGNASGFIVTDDSAYAEHVISGFTYRYPGHRVGQSRRNARQLSPQVALPPASGNAGMAGSIGGCLALAVMRG